MATRNTKRRPVAVDKALASLLELPELADGAPMLDRASWLSDTVIPSLQAAMQVAYAERAVAVVGANDDGASYADIAARLGVGKSMVQKIVQNQRAATG